jgi:methionyl-tRNA synthetase
MASFYVTTAIPYVNAAPHLGFALELVQADVLARYHRLRGDDTWFLTGTDENSLTNVLAAEREGLPVGALVDRNADAFRDLTRASISNDDFIRTAADARHRGRRAPLARLRRGRRRPKRVYRGPTACGASSSTADGSPMAVAPTTRWCRGGGGQLLLPALSLR